MGRSTRDSRSRSRHRASTRARRESHQGDGSHRDDRGGARGRERSGLSPGRRSRSPRQLVVWRRPLSTASSVPWEKLFPVPKDWRTDDAHIDTQLQHGLSLPRLVASTAYSRAHNSAGMPTHEVKFHQLLYGAQDSWLMHLLGNGRILSIWNLRLNAIKSCVPKIVKFMETLMPADTATALLAEIEKLRAENLQLWGRQSGQAEVPGTAGLPTSQANPAPVPTPVAPAEPSASASQRPLARFSVGYRTSEGRLFHLRSQEDVLRLLHELGSEGVAKFNTARLLRSRAAPLPFLYSLVKMSQHMGEPWRTRAVNQLRLILVFRGGALPVSNKILRVLPARPSFILKAKD